jgi:hypothetical protein
MGAGRTPPRQSEAPGHLELPAFPCESLPVIGGFVHD